MIKFSDIITLISTQGFEGAALEAFRFQSQACEPYSNYLKLLGIDPSAVTRVEDIPYLPIELFRSHRVYCAKSEPELCFSSSGTTGADTSRHYVASAELYNESFMSGFREFFGSENNYRLETLLPSYRPESSLLYMIDKLSKVCTGNRTILWGVTFALLEDARSGRDVTLAEGSIVVETGGMKGRGEEIARDQLHCELTKAYAVEAIASEYGMCELLSQAYSSGDGIFRTSSTMKVVGRSLDNPLAMSSEGELCGINIIDLANWYSCSFIATGDYGRVYGDGSFEVLGRIKGEILRGCNMLQ